MAADQQSKKRPGLLGRLWRFAWRLIFLAVLFLVGANLWIPLSQQHHIYTDAQEVPMHDFAIVLGTSKSVGNSANRHFSFRMEAAAALYKAGKVKWLLLSGDGEKPNYNEPADMRDALHALGVPADACRLDTMGLRSDMTFSRAKREFEISRAVIVSDDFHLPRCLMLAKHYGIDADAFYLKSVPWSTSSKSRMREWAARIRMYGDFWRE